MGQWVGSEASQLITPLGSASRRPSVSGAIIDTLRISAVRHQSEYSNVDNIRPNEAIVPEPGSIRVWAALMALACGMLSLRHLPLWKTEV